jgi:hypothetical protein
MSSKSFQQTRELGGTSGLHEFDGSAKEVSAVNLGRMVVLQYIQRCESEGLACETMRGHPLKALFFLATHN